MRRGAGIAPSPAQRRVVLRGARPRTGQVIAALVLVTGLVLAGCGEEPSGRPAGESPDATSSVPTPTSEPSSTQASPSSSSPAEPGQAITTADSEFGTMLFDENRQAIYLFDKETTSRPDCYGDCAVAWPPVLTTGPPRASGEVRPDLLGTTHRDDGSLQVTYAGHPLYYYAHEGPGQVLCHNVTDFGGRWLVITPDGTPAP